MATPEHPQNVNRHGPINDRRRRQVVGATTRFVELARPLCSRPLPVPEIRFDLRGRSAGMYRVQGGERLIRYNPWVFERHFEDNLANTVPHEVAHYVNDMIHGLAGIRPHGAEWKAVMRHFGVTPTRTCNYDIEGLPQRHYRRFEYHCGCSKHDLTAIRHNRIASGRRYFCRNCRGLLVSTGAETGLG